MLKKTLTLFITSILALSLCSFFGGGTSKVAIVDVQACHDESALGKHEENKIEGLKNKWRSDLESKENAFKSMREKYDDKDFRESLSDEARKEYEEKLGTSYRELEMYQGQFIRSMQQSGYEVAMNVLAAVETAAVKIAKEKGLEMVLRKETAIFYDSGLDITKEVVEEMNKGFQDQVGDNNSSATESKQS